MSARAAGCLDDLVDVVDFLLANVVVLAEFGAHVAGHGSPRGFGCLFRWSE